MRCEGHVNLKVYNGQMSEIGYISTTCVDNDAVAEKFSSHFVSSYTPNYPERANDALENYLTMRATAYILRVSINRGPYN